MNEKTTGKKQKTSKSRRETAVQGTNDNSIVSKCSMAAAGYFQDTYLQHFVAKMSKRAPIINRGYYIRAKCIDQALRRFLMKNQRCKMQIISLGAGFDSSFFRLKSEGLLQNCTFYEVDFPEVVRNKHALIQSHEELLKLLTTEKENKGSPHIELLSSQYCLIGVDLTLVNTLEAALRLCGVDFDAKTLFLSECVMTYMTRRCSSALVRWAGETFQDCSFVMFEQMNPDDAFGIFMQAHFHTIGSPLKCISSFPTMDSQVKRFLSVGWESCEIHDLNEVFFGMLSEMERRRLEALDPFDEYEEFNLMCAHYFLLIASSKTGTVFLDSALPLPEPLSCQADSLKGQVFVSSLAPDLSNIKRFSHSSVLVHGDLAVTAGGFGEGDGRHQRLQDVAITNTVNMETTLVRCRSERIQYSRMHHSSVALSNGQLLLYGGRQSPFFMCSQLLVLNVCMDLHQSDSSSCQALSASGHSLTKQKDTSVQSKPESSKSDRKMCTHSNCESPRCNMALCECVRDHENVMAERTRRFESPVTESRRYAYKCLDKDAVHSTDDTEGLDVCADPCGDSDADHGSDKRDLPGKNCPDFLLEEEERTEFHGGHLHCGVLRQSGDIPCPRWRHASALVQIEGKDFMIMHGGRTQHARVLGDTFLLNVHTGHWTQLYGEGSSPGPCHSHAMVTWVTETLQYVVLMGGLNEDQQPLSSIYLLDMKTHTWHIVPTTTPVLPRYSHTIHIVEDNLVMVGGINAFQQTPGIGIVSLKTGDVREFSFPLPKQDSLLMYHRHCSVLLSDGRILVIGGGGNCFSFGTHLNSTPVTVDISRCFQALP